MSTEDERRLLDSLHSVRLIGGLTHNFYRYPARMSPVFVREVISHFTRPGDVVFDPFLGGGTTLVEAVASGRRCVGVDLNSLATFVAEAKTTPLSKRDVEVVLRWASNIPALGETSFTRSPSVIDSRTNNFPSSLIQIFEHLLQYLLELPYPRQRRFARCAVLRLGQWAVDCRSDTPSPLRLRAELQVIIADMLGGLDQLVQTAADHGIEKRQITGQRSILLRSSVGIEDVWDPVDFGKPRLVLTSPPYPAVHVLYNRWQVNGRRETPAPYWLIDSPDGRGPSYFTMGSRSCLGLANYFRDLTDAFRSIRAVIDPDAMVVQLVSFSDTDNQLPIYLAAMEAAGFCEDAPTIAGREERWRTVPNRQWYYRIDASRGSARELLLIHRPA